MAVSVKCPNGHLLKVKDEFAGKSGLCPHCQTRVFVPMPVHTGEKDRISDDEILGLLGPPRKVKAEPPPPSDSVLDSGYDPAESGISLLRSSVSQKQKACPLCGHMSSMAFTHCPRCGTQLAEAGTGKK
jgi:ribosomal protein S27AE